MNAPAKRRLTDRERVIDVAERHPDLTASEVHRMAEVDISERRTQQIVQAMQNFRLACTKTRIRRSETVCAMLDSIVDPYSDQWTHEDTAATHGCSRRQVAALRSKLWVRTPRRKRFELDAMSDAAFVALVRARREIVNDMAEFERRIPVQPPTTRPRESDKVALIATSRRLDRAKSMIETLRKRPEHMEARACVRFFATLTPALLDEIMESGTLILGASPRRFVRIDIEEWQVSDLARMHAAVQRYHDQAHSHYEREWRAERGYGLSPSDSVPADEIDEMAAYAAEQVEVEPYPWDSAR